MTNRKLLRPWDRTEWTMLGPCATPPGMKPGDWYEITDGNITVKVQRSELERSYVARRNLIVGGYAVGDALRTYAVEYRIVERATPMDPWDQDNWCTMPDCPGRVVHHAGFGGSDEHLAAITDCTVYAYDMDGRPLETDCCSACVLQVIDGEHDTDPSRKVIVERSVTP